MLNSSCEQETFNLKHKYSNFYSTTFVQKLQSKQKKLALCFMSFTSLIEHAPEQ